MMKSIPATICALLLTSLGSLAQSPRENGKPPSGVTPQTGAHLSLEAQSALVKQYCVSCHSDRGRAGGLTLDAFDPAQIDRNAAVAEKMIRKLRAGMMPPPTAAPAARERRREGVRRDVRGTPRRSRGKPAESGSPPVPTVESRRIHARSARPARARRGRRRISAVRHDQRRIRQHRRRAVALRDADDRLPARGQLTSAGWRSAIGTARPTPSTYAIVRTEGQMRHVEGTPAGTRGGLSVVHIFPADGDYDVQAHILRRRDRRAVRRHDDHQHGRQASRSTSR